MIGQFGCLIITENGDVYNTEAERMICLFEDAKNNPVFRSPDTKSNWRLDYVMAMLFLNKGEFINDIKEYYVKHKDGNPKNCKLSNLELITDPDEVHDLRFGFMKGRKMDNSNRLVWPLYVVDKARCAIDTYSISEVSKKFGISESCAVKKAKNCERIYRDNFNLYLCETMLDAWETL